MVPIPLLIVAGEVLDRGEDPLALDAANEGRCRLAREKGILAEIFEIAAAQRRTMDVHAGPQENVHSASSAVAPDRPSHALGERRIERRSRGERRGVGCARPPVAAPGGSVRHLDLGNAEASDAANEKVMFASEVVDLLFERHPREQSLCSLLGRERGRRQSCRRDRPGVCQRDCGRGRRRGRSRRWARRAGEEKGDGETRESARLFHPFAASSTSVGGTDLSTRARANVRRATLPNRPPSLTSGAT